MSCLDPKVYLISCTDPNVKITFTGDLALLLAGTLGACSTPATNTPFVVTLNNPCGCWKVVAATGSGQTIPGYNNHLGDKPESDLNTTFLGAAYVGANVDVGCEACQTSVLAVPCQAAPDGNYYVVSLIGTGANNLASPSYYDKVYSSNDPELSGCFTIKHRCSVFGPGYFVNEGFINLDTTSPGGISLIQKQNCAECMVSITCTSLKDCASNGATYEFWLSDTLPFSGALPPSGIVKCTIPVGMVNRVNNQVNDAPLEGCFIVGVTNSTDCTAYDLGTITQYQTCQECASCLTIYACDDIYEFYSVITADQNIHNYVANCANQCNGCISVIEIDLGDGYGYRCFRITSDCLQGAPVQNFDLLSPLSYQLYCETDPCYTCVYEPSCYLATFCAGGAPSVILRDPVVSGGGVVPIGNYYDGSIDLGNGTVLTGCFTLTPVSCSSTNPTPLTGATIDLGSPGLPFGDCDECLGVIIEQPPVYQLTRCDDPAISYVVNTDLSALVGRSIKNITLVNCETGPTPCNILATQCWSVSQIPYQTTLIEVSYDSEIYPDCKCCNDSN